MPEINKQSSSKDSVPEPPFELNDKHKKALTTLLHAYHNNRQTMTYPELSLALNIGEKTKAWQSGAWKDLKSNEYIVSKQEDKKQFELSDKGVALASTFLTTEELAEFAPPATTELLHERIKKKLSRLEKNYGDWGCKILDYMNSKDYVVPMGKHDLAHHFGTLADSHGFFYGLQALIKWGYVGKCEPHEIALLLNKNASLTKNDGVEATTKSVSSTPEGDAVETNNEDTSKDEPAMTNGEKNIDTSPTTNKKKKRLSVSVSDDDDDVPKKKKGRKSKKDLRGGHPLKLTDKAFIN